MGVKASYVMGLSQRRHGVVQTMLHKMAMEDIRSALTPSLLLYSILSLFLFVVLEIIQIS
jgi:hypothetical protein